MTEELYKLRHPILEPKFNTVTASISINKPKTKNTPYMGEGLHNFLTWCVQLHHLISKHVLYYHTISGTEIFWANLAALQDMKSATEKLRAC